MGTGGSFQRVSGLGVKLNPHLHLVPKLRMSGVIPLLSPIYPHCVDRHNCTSDRCKYKLVAPFYRMLLGYASVRIRHLYYSSVHLLSVPVTATNEGVCRCHWAIPTLPLGTTEHAKQVHKRLATDDWSKTSGYIQNEEITLASHFDVVCTVHHFAMC